MDILVKALFLFKKNVNRYFSQKAGIGIDGFTYCSCLCTIIQHIFSVVEHTNKYTAFSNGILLLVIAFDIVFPLRKYKANAYAPLVRRDFVLVSLTMPPRYITNITRNTTSRHCLLTSGPSVSSGQSSSSS